MLRKIESICTVIRFSVRYTPNVYMNEPMILGIVSLNPSTNTPITINNMFPISNVVATSILNK